MNINTVMYEEPKEECMKTSPFWSGAGTNALFCHVNLTSHYVIIINHRLFNDAETILMFVSCIIK
jgi:hypothetical protein